MQLHTGTLIEGQSFILHFLFPFAGCYPSVFSLLCSFTLLLLFDFFYTVVRLCLLMFSFYFPLMISFFLFLILFLLHLLFLFYLLYLFTHICLLIQNFLHKKRLPHNHKLLIFQKQNLYVRINHIKIINYVFFLEAHK